MRLILDTHVLLAVLRGRLGTLSPALAKAVEADEVRSFASVASLWEIAIKTRLGKLDPGMSLHLMPQAIHALNIAILPVTAAHAIAEVDPLPPTRDPFDRLRLTQCAVEGLPTRDARRRHDRSSARRAHRTPIPEAAYEKSENPPLTARPASTAAREAGAVSASRSAA